MAATQENSPDVLYRHCKSDADFEACIALQRDTWGADDVVPMTLLKAAQKVGGIVAGAFDSTGGMLGCVFGMSGLREGRPTHWSHMLAVVPKARGKGLGYRLKMFQRDALLDLGIDHMFWTYDPLESINAHFNINRLGARPIEYVQDMYGHGETNLLHQGLGTDRFVVYWDLRKNVSASNADDARYVRIEAPQAIQELKKTQPDQARTWRKSTREAFQNYFGKGYEVTGFYRTDDDRCYYLLELKA